MAQGSYCQLLRMNHPLLSSDSLAWLSLMSSLAFPLTFTLLHSLPFHCLSLHVHLHIFHVLSASTSFSLSVPQTITVFVSLSMISVLLVILMLFCFVLQSASYIHLLEYHSLSLSDFLPKSAQGAQRGKFSYLTLTTSEK